jgi:hypothetical protein
MASDTIKAGFGRDNDTLLPALRPSQTLQKSLPLRPTREYAGFWILLLDFPPFFTYFLSLAWTSGPGLAAAAVW